MIKRLLLAMSALVAMVGSAVAAAQTVGIVDMRQVFQSSPQVKQINARLAKQFSPQRTEIIKLGQSLEENVKKLQRNQSVMNEKDLESLRTEIQKQQAQLQQKQGAFQQALFMAQNNEMSSFITKITGVVKTVAEKDKLDLVLSKDTVLYAKDSKDITSDVISALK